ncbi:TPA: hypothetical protein ACNOH1_002108, partial [Providencia rettgeri]
HWRGESELSILNEHITNSHIHITSEKTSLIRYSTLLMGALIGIGTKKITIPYPGGCSSFGTRPIDIHLLGFEAIGAIVNINESSIDIDCQQLKESASYKLRFPSVGASINLIFAAASLKKGMKLYNIALEPEVIELINFCNKIGFEIKFIGERDISILYNNKQKFDITFSVMPDRIETISYMILGSLLAQDHLIIKKPNILHTKIPRDFLSSIGILFDVNHDNIVVYRSKNLKPAKLESGIYPQIGTDYQPLIACALLYSDGNSEIYDPIYPKRFLYLKELEKVNFISTVMDGFAKLYGNPNHQVNDDVELYCHDLRAGFACLMIGLLNHGETTLLNAEQILRGYGDIKNKLQKIGISLEVIEN